jgi:hypothetical protein
MLILVDKRAPEMVRKNLGKLGNIIEFETDGLVYAPISGHPDIFITQCENFIIAAPNLPDEYKNILKNNNISFIEGVLPVGNKYPQTARYNAVFSPGYFIHNLTISDEKTMTAAVGKTKIHIAQGYTRCNLLPLNDEKMITSDHGIYTALKNYGTDVFFVQPKGILLPGFKNGFIGGACGIFEKTVYVMGHLNYHPDGKNLRLFIRDAGFEIVELYNGPLFDGGGIFFLK